MRYVDRIEAGRHLATLVAETLLNIAPAEQRALVLGVPRGGVIVGRPVAAALGSDFGVALARKIGAPSNPELAIGAIGEQGSPVLDDGLVAALGVADKYIEDAVVSARIEIGRQAAAYRGDTAAASVRDRLVIVVDDGIATGATLIATLRAIRSQRPQLLVAAAPVGAPASVDRVAEEADYVVCAVRPRSFRSVGEWFDVFAQTTDEEVVAALMDAR